MEILRVPAASREVKSVLYLVRGDTGGHWGSKTKGLKGNIHYCDNFCFPVKDSSLQPWAFHLRPLALLKALEPPNCAELLALFCNR